MPQPLGSLVGGVLLIAVGLMLFAHTMFRVPLEWLAQWWPLASLAGRVVGLRRPACEAATGESRRDEFVGPGSHGVPTAAIIPIRR